MILASPKMVRDIVQKLCICHHLVVFQVEIPEINLFTLQIHKKQFLVSLCITKLDA